MFHDFTTERYCENCGQAFTPSPFRRFFKINAARFCSRQCHHDHRYALPPNTLAKRFWAKVQKTPDCWLWTGATNHGYGVIGLGRHTDGNAGAHRVSWELHYGTIPAGMHVCHACDVRLCVRPDHLFLGTNTDNTSDRIAKGRQGGGVRKLSPETVREIRRLAAAGTPQRQIARAFGIAPSVVSEIVSRKAWKHIE